MKKFFFVVFLVTIISLLVRFYFGVYEHDEFTEKNFLLNIDLRGNGTFILLLECPMLSLNHFQKKTKLNKNILMNSSQIKG